MMTSVPDPQAVNIMLLTKRFQFPHLTTQNSSSVMSSSLHFKSKTTRESHSRQGSRELEAPALHCELNLLMKLSLTVCVVSKAHAAG